MKYIYHNEPGGCNSKALIYVSEELSKPGDILYASQVQRLDGSACVSGEVAICGSCGQIIKRINADDIK